MSMEWQMLYAEGRGDRPARRFGSHAQGDASMHRRNRAALSVLALAALARSFTLAAPAQTWTPATTSEVGRFTGTMDNVKATFGPAEPVAHVRPGAVLEASALDCNGNALQKPGDPFSSIRIENP